MKVTLAQVVTLATDPRVPEDRRVLYAMRFLGGPRPGEAANARWRDLDRTKRPLWRLTLQSSFNSPMRREKGTKTGAELNIPVHPVLQRMLELWEASGWEEFMGRKPTRDDLIVPRADGTQRLVSTSYKQFHADLAAVGLEAQRQYESRATFRNLALAAGVPKYQVDLITHPKPTQGPDFYNRLDMLWSGLCAGISAIDAGAWNGRLASLAERVTPESAENEKPPTSLENVGGELEREKGFESVVSPGVSGTYATPDNALDGSARLPDASVRVSTELDAGDTRVGARCLPVLTPDLFIQAGVILAERAGSDQVERTKVEGILRRALDQASAASDRGNLSVPPIP